MIHPDTKWFFCQLPAAVGMAAWFLLANWLILQFM